MAPFAVQSVGPVTLTIAGFDPSSGAGITADLAVFAAHRCFGIAAITALTVQSTVGVFGVHTVSPGVLSETLLRLEQDLPPAAVKIGMLGGAAQVREVVHYLEDLRVRRQVTIVLDPVLRSSSGASLLESEGLKLLEAELLPLVDVMTPNIAELHLLTNLQVGGMEEVEIAAELLQHRHPSCAIVVTGGHLSPPNDLLLSRGERTWFSGERIDTQATHGTGCAFASALTCALAAGEPLGEAVMRAKRYVAEAMRTAVARGSGPGPLNLLWPLLQDQSVAPTREADSRAAHG